MAHPTVKPFIALENITLIRDGQSLFQDTTWTMNASENWAIIGPNGSGKTTLAQALMGKVPLPRGEIRYYFDKDNPNDLGRTYLQRGEVIMIGPEDHQYLLHRSASYLQARWQSFEADEIATVSEYLTGARIEHTSPYEVTPLRLPETVYQSRRDQAVATLKINYLLDRKLLHLSHGELRKVLLARALMQSPRLLVLDEPFGGLDPSFRETLKETINAIISGGETRVLLLTSRPEEIPTRITNILMVAGNRITAQDQAANLLPTVSALAPTVSKNRFNLRPPSPVSPNLATNYPVLIELCHVNVAYDEIHVLTDINWIVRPGERWAVLGHNGAGKSTLLSLILADNPQAYANQITLFGKTFTPGNNIWEIKKLTGYLSPELQVYYPGGWSCLEVICSGYFDSIGLFQTCTAGQISTATNWLEYLGLSFRSSQALQDIPPGEQRLILLARALVKDPPLLILDEPCQGLDLNHRQQILDLLDSVCQSTPISLIFVTHHHQEMPQAISHTLKLAQGRIIAGGPTKTRA